MQRFASVIISTLFIAASPTVSASETAMNPTALNNTTQINSVKTSPVDLVYLAYRGYFKDRGIPSSQTLITAYSLGNISAEKLIQAGVETQRVTSDVLEDAEYVSAVESMLNNLKTR